MLADAFAVLSPRLAERYQTALTELVSASPELSSLHDAYLCYAALDNHLPRPVLAYFGYHARSDAVDFKDLEAIGDGLLISQLLRDFLAIHDDIVDEDLDKFGAPPLPVVLSSGHSDPLSRVLTQSGKDLALYYGDFLLGGLFRWAATTGTRGTAVTRLLGDTLYVNQRGQLAEILTERRSLADTTVADVFLIGERKAAYYCYSFPFTLGATLAGHPDDVILPVAHLLTAIGTLSQAVDDLTGAFPGIIDRDKDTLGEIVHLRRTLPLVLLGRQTVPADIAALLIGPTPLPVPDARRLRDHLWHSSVPEEALAICRNRLNEIQLGLGEVPTGLATTAYLRDLVDHRLTASLDHLAAAR